MSLMKELIEYVRSEPGLDRLLHALLERYIQLGRIGGSVQLRNLTIEEKESLSLFFRKDYSRQKTITISFSSFEKALLQTKFAEVNIQDMLNSYAGKIVFTKMEVEERYQQQKELFFKEFMQSYPEHSNWIDFVAKKGRGTRLIHQLYDKHPDYLKELMNAVCTALSLLPSPPKYERLPFFSEKITQNPHAFDLDQHGGKILLHALQFILWQKGEIPYIRGKLNAEEASDLLQTFSLLRDDLLNFVTCIGLSAETTWGKYPVFEAANSTKTVLNIPLREISTLTACRPVKGNTVFIVENSGVCSELLDRWPFSFPPPLISTNGQFKLAALLLIDLLISSNTLIYYSGDFDPEGLLMADKLLNRSPSHIKLWRYSVTDYKLCQATVNISTVRLAQLEKLRSDQLLPLRKEVTLAKKSGYQEKLVPMLLKDMKSQLLNT